MAFDLADKGAADGTVVVAGTQSAGRGRRGRTWYDVPGESLLTSLIVRPRLRLGDLPKLSLTTAVAVVEALESAAALRARVKWPNDVLVGGRKIAGILLESRITAQPVVAVGVGVNLAQRAFPPGLEATSVALETGRPLAVESMLEALLAAFDAWRARLETAGFASIRRRWLEAADTIGRVVGWEGTTGVAVDLDGDGALVIRGDDGRRHIVTGEVVAPGAGD